MYLYRVSQEEMSIFWDIIVSVILSKNLYMYTCPIPNGLRDIAISLCSVKLLIKRYYVLFLISVFIIQVTKYNTFSKISRS